MPKKLKAKQIAAKLLGRHGDGGGLWLHVRKSGSRSWELRWMLRGKAESMGLGSYPDVSLAQAREAAHECRRMVLEGRDPRKARAPKIIEEKLRPSFREFS